MPDRIATSIDVKPRRSGSIAKSDTRPVRIERGRVINVNINDYTVDVRTEMPPYKPKFDIPWMVPYAHYNQGEGINFMPEVGSTCWICEPTDNGRDSFVLGWTMPEEGGSYRSGRPLLNPGDQHFSTRDGNFVILRRGGVVQIGATPICQRVFIPIRNVIQDYAENYELHTPAGDLTWNVMRKDEDGDGHQKCLFTLAAHEYADDSATSDPVAILKIGSHGDQDDTIVTLVTRDKTGGSIKTKLTLSKSGDLNWKVEGDFNLSSTGDMTLSTSGKASVKATGDAELVSSNGAATLKGLSNATVQSNTEVNIKAPQITADGNVISLGEGLFSVLRNSPDFIQWVSILTAVATTVTGGAVNPPTFHTSKKVKA